MNAKNFICWKILFFRQWPVYRNPVYTVIALPGSYWDPIRLAVAERVLMSCVFELKKDLKNQPVH
jgi:hypothetical protein